MTKKLVCVIIVLSMILVSSIAIAQNHGEDQAKDTNSQLTTFIYIASIVAACLAIGLGVHGPGVGMGQAVRGAMEGIARNPQQYGKLLGTLMIGLAIIESLAIYALIVALIVLFANPFILGIG